MFAVQVVYDDHCGGFRQSAFVAVGMFGDGQFAVQSFVAETYCFAAQDRLFVFENCGAEALVLAAVAHYVFVFVFVAVAVARAAHLQQVHFFKLSLRHRSPRES